MVDLVHYTETRLFNFLTILHLQIHTNNITRIFACIYPERYNLVLQYKERKGHHVEPAIEVNNNCG